MKKLKVSRLGLIAFVASVAFAQVPQPGASPDKPATNAGASSAIGPKIKFAETVHDFGKVNAGSVVKCEFVFTNEGDATLEITGVHTTCGCTTAGEWTRQVEPGQTGRIPLQFNTGGYGGHVMKTVTINSNDKDHPSVVLQLKALVWKPVDVVPQFAVIYGNAETLAEGKATVRIVNNEEQPIEVWAPECSNEFFTVDLKTNQPGKEFELVIRAVPQPKPSNRQAVVMAKTSSTNMPQINVVSMVILQPVVTVSPPQINLPPGPLAEGMTFTLTVRNAGTNVITLSDPEVNAKDVAVDIKELEPGRAFNVMVRFPAGFVVEQGKPAEISLKSSHPDYPVLKVPVTQPPPPAAANPVAARTAAVSDSTPPMPPAPR